MSENGVVDNNLSSGYFGIGKLSFGGIGKVVMSAVETQIAVASAPTVTSVTPLPQKPQNTANSTHSTVTQKVKTSPMYTKHSKSSLVENLICN